LVELNATLVNLKRSVFVVISIALSIVIIVRWLRGVVSKTPVRMVYHLTSPCLASAAEVSHQGRHHTWLSPLGVAHLACSSCRRDQVCHRGMTETANTTDKVVVWARQNEKTP